MGICLREPLLLRSPRFWAEEATVYFEHARDVGVAALATPHLGYYSLFSNLAGFLASLPRPEAGPWVTTLLALGIQLIPVALVLAGRIAFLRTPGRQALALAALILASPSEEVWLNTINSQFHLALASVLLLLESEGEPSRSGLWARRALLVLAGMTGPVTCFLLPLFLWRAWRTRQREAWIQAGLLTACVGAHLAIWGAAFLREGLEAASAGRARPSLDVISTSLVTRALFEPVLGLPLAHRLASAVVRGRALPWRAVLLAGGCAVLLLGWSWAMQYRQRFQVRLLAVSGPLLAALCMVGSLGSGDKSQLVLPTGGYGRYFYVPAVLVLLLVISALAPDENNRFSRMRRALALPLLILAFASHTSGLVERRGQHADWPRWRDEVAAWRQDPTYRPRIWPPDWRVALE
ncbi:hypothetical protein NVS55_16445 [Myxococcus stipitatus]|uniref:hypothetical protein n=1 Tax=Myxococcus stipitatus TaxID=83455 RepID=UPI00314537F2